jgi:hypothetical protein
MLKNEDVNNDADDVDEMRTSVSQNCSIETLSNVEFFLRTQYLYVPLSSYQQRGAGKGDRE